MLSWIIQWVCKPSVITKILRREGRRVREGGLRTEIETKGAGRRGRGLGRAGRSRGGKGR